YTKINKKELLNKYIETREINLPAYIKSVTPENLNYYYPLKFDYRNEYSKKHYVYSSNSYQLDKGIEYFVRKSISGQIVFVMTDYLKKSIKIKEKISKVLSLFGNKNKDRKSTRLNSSHVSISYAVFCLKKKKNYCNIIIIIVI